MILNCFIIDDEPLAIEVIENHISKIDTLEIAGTFQNAVKAFQALRDIQVDVLFLDIQMPRLTGIEFLRTLKNPPKVIFTTAYREYALEGFELDVVDYLLKPISFDRFLKAVDKLYDNIPSSTTVEVAAAHPSPRYVFVTSEKKNIKICLDEIEYVESKRDYILIKTSNKEVLTHQTITYMDEHLPDECFLRVHRSFIINLKKLDSWNSHEVEISGETIPIGRTYKREALDVLSANSEVL